jgi:hypothetical protein
MHIGLMMSVCPSGHSIQLQKCRTDFEEILYGHYGTGGYAVMLFNLLQWVITTWWMHKLVTVSAVAYFGLSTLHTSYNIFFTTPQFGLQYL